MKPKLLFNLPVFAYNAQNPFSEFFRVLCIFLSFKIAINVSNNEKRDKILL